MSYTWNPQTQYGKLNMQFFMIVGAEKILLCEVFQISAIPKRVSNYSFGFQNPTVLKLCVFL